MARIVSGQKFGQAPRESQIKSTDIIRMLSNQSDVTATMESVKAFISGEISGIVLRNQKTVVGTYLVVGEEDMIYVDATAAAFSITLPDTALVEKGYQVTIKKIDSSSTNNVTVLPHAPSQTIDSNASAVLAGALKPLLSLVSDGARWWVVNG